MEHDFHSCKVENVSLDIANQELRERNEQLICSVSKLSATPKSREHDLEISQVDINGIKSGMKLADVFTMDLMIQYLKLDSYELVKNIAKTINKSNFGETSLFIDGALSRNEAFISILSECSKGRTFTNRIKGEVENTKRK